MAPRFESSLEASPGAIRPFRRRRPPRRPTPACPARLSSPRSPPGIARRNANGPNGSDRCRGRRGCRPGGAVTVRCGSVSGPGGCSRGWCRAATVRRRTDLRPGARGPLPARRPFPRSRPPRRRPGPRRTGGASPAWSGPRWWPSSRRRAGTSRCPAAPLRRRSPRRRRTGRRGPRRGGRGSWGAARARGPTGRGGPSPQGRRGAGPESGTAIDGPARFSSAPRRPGAFARDGTFRCTRRSPVVRAPR